MFTTFLYGSIPSAVTGVLAVVGSAAFFFGISWYGQKATYRDLARWYAHSSAFWARWSGDRLWAAPYPELVAEARRCEDLINNLDSKRPFMGPKAVLVDRKRARELRAGFRQDVEREIATYKGLLAAVHNAMHYAVGQGRGPQVPPHGR
ncbi:MULTISPECIES: hypothetical protein [Mycolicibacterium]|uniref:hypothetical protein n=1 Tax=Mycolicibacterium TaxID=1866885 RepID=UPI0011AEC38B|nr:MULTISPECIES: hypothetical protein [Mycolicibacterium]MCV7336898.1 hypothetical protein [Mycolicibacterium senegalense]MDR7287595.1 hypothetical protein [Mycolicibacterium senegalense]QZA24633.1 hypothetical protein K3U95_00445 [Mycolicibacterium senegalense]